MNHRFLALMRSRYSNKEMEDVHARIANRVVVVAKGFFSPKVKAFHTQIITRVNDFHAAERYALLFLGHRPETGT